MVRSPLQQAGVETRHYEGEGLSMEELTPVQALRLKSRAPVESLASRLELRLPDRVNTASGEAPAVLCLGPREWWLLDPPESIQVDAIDSLDEATACRPMGDGLAGFRIQGEASAWLLSKLSALDFQSGRAAGRHCARTRMGRIAVVVHYHAPQPGGFVFDLYTDRSVAVYLWNLLLDAAAHAGELARQHGSEP